MAGCLKKRVRYNFEVYTTNKCGWYSEMSVFYIYVDDELWFASNPKYYWEEGAYLSRNVDHNLPRDEYWETYRKAYPDAVDYASSHGLMAVDRLMQLVHEYLNVLSIKECLDSGNYILKMFAVLDRRAGKRTIKRLADNISNEPEWFRKYIILRAESEGISCGRVNEMEPADA